MVLAAIGSFVTKTYGSTAGIHHTSVTQSALPRDQYIIHLQLRQKIMRQSKKLSLLNCVPYAPWVLLSLRTLRAFVPYFPLWLMRLRTLRDLSCLIYAACAPFSWGLRALFVHVKIFLQWICSPSKIFHFPRIIKGTTNCAVFKWIKKTAVKTFKRGNF